MASPRKKTSLRTELMSAMKDTDVEAFINITKSVSGSELCDALAEISRAQLQELWECVYGLCTSTLLAGREGEDADSEFAEEIHRVLKSTTELAQATVSALLSQTTTAAVASSDQSVTTAPLSLQQTVILLHSMLPNLDERASVLRNQMSRLCEDWWRHSMPGRQEVAPNTLLYLLTRSTHPKSYQADVSRVWAMREMLEYVIASQQEVASALTPLLLQCIHHPQFLTSKHGTKFLALTFNLTPALTDSLHQGVKTFIFTTPRSWHTKYGEIYFQSWYTASDNMRQKLEESCIQDWMFRAVHACRQGPHCAAATLFRLLSHFHKQKTQRGVESMLCRLYGPILWRSLKVTNSDVRLNAASLMFNVFPLQDPNLLREEADAALQRQFDLMNALLSDPVVEIRVAAVLGIGRVLSMYWELIPVQVIQSLIMSLVQDIAYDAASPAVREAVFKVMYQLCDNHLCIPVLKKVLPELGDFIHDSSEKVRVAMLDLLLKVKGLRAIKFWSIVPVEHILARLETDSPFVIRRIMSLISSSFVPLQQPPSQQVERCLTLITSNRAAARQFFLNLPKSLGVVDTTKFVLVLCRYALESSRLWTKNLTGHLQSGDSNEENESVTAVSRSKKPRSKGKKRRSRSSLSVDNDEEEDTSSTERSTAETSLADSGVEGEVAFSMELLSGLMEGVYLMVTAIVSQLASPEHLAMREGLMKKLCVTVRELIKISQDPLLDQALIGLGGHLPSRGLPLISQNLFNKLKQTCSSGQKDRLGVLETSGAMDRKKEEITTVVKALVQWGRADDVLEVVQESISSYLKKEVVATTTSVSSKGAKLSPKGGRKKVCFTATSGDESRIDVEKALQIVDAMISHAECRPILMSSKYRHSLVSLVEGVEKDLQEHLQQTLKVLSNLPADTGNGRANKKKMPPVAFDIESELSVSASIFPLFMRLVGFLSLQQPEVVKDDDNKENRDRNENSDMEDDDAGNGDGFKYLQNSLSWARKYMLPQLGSFDPQDVQSHCAVVDFVSGLVCVCLRSFAGLVIVGRLDETAMRLAGDICSECLQLSPTVLTTSLLESVLGLTYQLTQVRRKGANEEEVEEEMEADELPVEVGSLDKVPGRGNGKKLTVSPLQCPLLFGLSVFEAAYKFLSEKEAARQGGEVGSGRGQHHLRGKDDAEAMSRSKAYSYMVELLQALISPGVSLKWFEKVTAAVSNLVIQDLERLSQRDGIGQDEKSPGVSMTLNQRLATCLRKRPQTLRSFLDSCIAHLSSDQASVHSLHGVVHLVPTLKSTPTDSAQEDLKAAVSDCLEMITANGMDEDVFRDVKIQVEQKIKRWTEASTGTRTTEEASSTN